ncbi:MAG: hypothetical protein RL675_1066 [Bacteroidota bacterium]
MRPTDDLEDLLKERADQYLLYPSDAVWSNIQKELHPARTWAYIAVAALLLFSTGLTMVIKKESSSIVKPRAGQIAYQFLKQETGEDGFLKRQIEPVAVKSAREVIFFQRSRRLLSESLLLSNVRQKETLEAIALPEMLSSANINTINRISKPKKSAAQRIDKKNIINSAIASVVQTAKKIGKETSWQIYGGPTLGYRFLSGKASRSNYQYTTFSLSTNAQFPRNAKDVVNHRPGLGFELGTAMIYPLSKRWNIRAGLQANYNQYQIDAYSSIPEIANYGMNNLRTGSTPISTVSYYSNTDGYRKATLRNEHYMLSLPVGLDYKVIGNHKINLTVGTSIQPTYVFANYSYLISTNLKNYAKAPYLNRRWNVNSSVEASLNVQQGKFRWSVAPQFRYQLLSSFKEKYPIRENLTDMGIKVGIIRTIQ